MEKLKIVLLICFLFFGKNLFAYDKIDVPISSEGVVSSFTISCSGTNATASLVAKQWLDGLSEFYAPGAYMRRPCIDGLAHFDSYDLQEMLNNTAGPYPEWTRHYRVELVVIIKDTTDLVAPDYPLYYQTVNLNGAFNFYNLNVYRPEHTDFPTMAMGDVFKFDGEKWIKMEPPVPECCSNVLFIPGLMGSRLYSEVSGNEKELWVSTSNLDQIKLLLDDQGKSKDLVYTKNDTVNNGEMDESGIVDDIFSLNIYQSFISDLRNLKQEGKINDYAFIPYDWRLSLEDIINNGATTTDGDLIYTNDQDFSNSFLLHKLSDLQKSSNTGKVTIVAHSNGGLVTKALIQKLKDTGNPLYNKIDKIIFVAVPQIGTPDALIGLLHGTELGWSGTIMSKEMSRQIAENMPTVYNLLPSNNYFSIVDQGISADTVISFDNNPIFSKQTTNYGYFIQNPGEMENYLLGAEGRTKPMVSDTASPNIGNSTIYSQAKIIHSVLDNWQPSPTTKVVQIAGWGEETVSGLDYKAYKNSSGGYYISYKPKTVIDGDGTVVVPSALWMPISSQNVERWWVDLKSYDRNNNFSIKRIHRDILEIPNLRNFITSKIENTDFSDFENIVVNNTSSLVSDKTRLYFTLHSPLHLGVKDSQDRYTGIDPANGEIREEIPNSSYKQIGDVQSVSVPNDDDYTLVMDGYKDGLFALDIDKKVDQVITESASFQAIPSSVNTIATLETSSSSDIGDSILQIDNNGDGLIDKSLSANPDGITLYDDIAPEISISFSTTTKEVLFSGIDESPVSVSTSSSNIVAIDSQGNKSVLDFIRYREKSTRLSLSFNKITRNEISTAFPITRVFYNWSEKKGQLTDLDTSVIIKGEERYIFNYSKLLHKTIIQEKIGRKMKITTKKGFVPVTITTKGDCIEVNY